MTLSTEESELIEKIIRFALCKSKLSFRAQLFPPNLAPIIEKWKEDEHPFRQDGTALLGFCMVTQKNVEVLLKEVQEASEKILLDVRILLTPEELSTEIGELVECDCNYKTLAKFTAEKNKITIADAVSSDFWGLGASSSLGDFDDLEVADESLLDRFSVDFDEDVEEPKYPSLHIDTSYIPYDSGDVPKMYQITSPQSPETLGIMHVDCSEELTDFDTAPHSVITEASSQDLFQDSPQPPSPIVSPPLPRSQTWSPVLEDSHFPRSATQPLLSQILELHLEDLPVNFEPNCTSTPKKRNEKIDQVSTKRARIERSRKVANVLEDYEPNDEQLYCILNSEKLERRRLLENLKKENRDMEKIQREKLKKIVDSPVTRFLDGLEPKRWREVREESEELCEDSQPSTDLEDYPEPLNSPLNMVDENFTNPRSPDHPDYALEHQEAHCSSFSDMIIDSGIETLSLEDSESCPESSGAQGAPEMSSEDIKAALTRDVENADGEPVAFSTMLSTICPSANRKSAARAFFAILEMAKTRTVAPPTQNDPFGEIFVRKY